MSVKKLAKNHLEFNPVKHFKNAVSTVKRDITSKPDTSEDPAVTAARTQQNEMLADLNNDTNATLKRLLSNSQGVRAFTGSALSRLTPGDRAAPSTALAGATAPQNVPLLQGRSLLSR